MARRVEKPWGFELVWAEGGAYVGKVLVIDAGARLSLQYHETKDETILVTEGQLRLHIVDGDGASSVDELGIGDHYHVPPGRIHRYEGGPDGVTLIEVSTPDLDDVVRLDDDFGREGTTAP